MSSAISRRINVDLPDPDGPIRKTNSPLSTLRVTLSNAGRVDALYCLVTWSRVIITGGQSSRGRRDYRAGAAEAAAAAGLPVAWVGAGVAVDASGDAVSVGVGVAPVVDAPGDVGDEVSGEPDSDVVSPDVVGVVVSQEVVGSYSRMLQCPCEISSQRLLTSSCPPVAPESPCTPGR